MEEFLSLHLSHTWFFTMRLCLDCCITKGFVTSNCWLAILSCFTIYLLRGVCEVFLAYSTAWSLRYSFSYLLSVRLAQYTMPVIQHPRVAAPASLHL